MALSPRYMTQLGGGLLGYDDGLARYQNPQELAFQRSFAANPAWFMRTANPGGALTGDPNTPAPAAPQSGLLSQGDRDAGGGMDQGARAGGQGGSVGGFGMPSVGGLMNPYSAPTNMALGGMLASAATGVPGLGLAGAGLGGLMEANAARNDFTSAYGTPEVNTMSAIGNALTGGMMGESGLQQAVNSYQGLSGTSLNDAALSAFASGPASYSGPKGVVGPGGGASQSVSGSAVGVGSHGLAGSPEIGASKNYGVGAPDLAQKAAQVGMTVDDYMVSQNSGQSFSYGDNSRADLATIGNRGGDSSTGSGDKIVCTAMNAAYGFGTFRQKVWLAQSATLHPAYQKGYHALFRPLVRYAYGTPKPFSAALRRALEHIARHRTADIRRQKSGKRDMIGAVERAVFEPLCYWMGRIIG